MAIKYDSEETKQKILSSSVRLFIEKGYHETTMTEILHDAGVSGSSFHSIFHTKDGVLAELTEFMFENQFGVAEKIIGTGKNPVLLYAVETCIQLTLTEMNEHLRDIYMEVYTQPALMDYIHKHTAKKIAMIFRQYNKDFQESDFYEMEIGTAGCMRAYIAKKCDVYFTLEKKLERFLRVTLGAYHVPDDIQRETIAYIEKLKIREITGQVMNKLFMALAMKYDFTFHEANTKKK